MPRLLFGAETITVICPDNLSAWINPFPLSKPEKPKILCSACGNPPGHLKYPPVHT